MRTHKRYRACVYASNYSENDDNNDNNNNNNNLYLFITIYKENSLFHIHIS